MKIVILGTAYPYRGGLSAFNERLAREYQSMGHEVIIYTFTHQYPNFLFPGKTQYSTEPAPQDLNIVRKVHSYNPFNWCKVGREIARLKPDMMITKFWLPFMSPCFGTIARKVRRNKHTRLISILDNVIPGSTMFSGSGGQLDFMLGAGASEGGIPIVAMPSITAKGVSKIVPTLTVGAGVVTPRTVVHWVITEYGAVNLFGKPLRERAKLLISIAHPSVREELEKSIQKQ